MARCALWLLLLLLLQVCCHVSLAHDLTAVAAISGNCSRENSRHARNVLQQYLFKHLGDSASHLPRECPLHPAIDMFKDQEHHKSKKNKDQHKCGYCGKVFKAEPYLDKHMQKKHVDRIPEGATSCLADHCDSLHCEWFKLRHLESSSRAQIRSKRAQLGTQCVPFLAALARQSCHELAAKCFPIDTPDRAMRTSHHHGLREPFEQHWDAARAFFEAYFCEAVTCNLQVRDTLLEHVVRSSTVWSRWKGQLVVLLVLLAMFYAGLYMWWWVSQQQQEQQQQQQQQQQTSDDDPAGKLSRRARSRHLIPAVGRMSMGMPSSPSRQARKQVASPYRSSPARQRPMAGAQASQLQESNGDLLGKPPAGPDHGQVLHSSLQTSLTQLHSRQGPSAGQQGQGWHAGKLEPPAGQQGWYAGKREPPAGQQGWYAGKQDPPAAQQAWQAGKLVPPTFSGLAAPVSPGPSEGNGMEMGPGPTVGGGVVMGSGQKAGGGLKMGPGPAVGDGVKMSLPSSGSTVSKSSAFQPPAPGSAPRASQPPVSTAPGLAPTASQPPSGQQTLGNSRPWAPAVPGGVLPPPPLNMPPPPPLLGRGAPPPMPPPRPVVPGPLPPTSSPYLLGVPPGQLRPPTLTPHPFPQQQVPPPLYRHPRAVAPAQGTGATQTQLPNPLAPQVATSAAFFPLAPPAGSAGFPAPPSQGPWQNGNLNSSTLNGTVGQGGTMENGAKN